MYHLRLTLETPELNVAHDETLLAQAEAGKLPGEVLRLWESPQPTVILGRSSPASEVHAEACRADGVPVWRRASGGAAVVAGPGCLMYAVILDRQARPELSGIDRAHNFVLRRLVAALSPLAPGVVCAGTSDLVLAGEDDQTLRKFSGNALRMKRRHLLYHGTILYDFPLQRVGRWLAEPARQPKYREGRDHDAFLTNFPATRAAIETTLIAAWQAHEPLSR